MNKVVTVNLNGRAYQLEESGYTVLHEYLERAQTTLDVNPDKDEVMADFEQAIADKCDAHLAPHKTVITTAEIKKIIDDMGPVDGDDGAEKDNGKQNGGKKSDEKSAPKRLYQIREGAIISGVCNGIAAYINVDVTIVRVIFVVLVIVTSGAWILAYVALALLVPYANTSEEKAKAYGLHFNAHELLASAKEKYAMYDKKYFSTQKKYWKDWAKNKKHEWANYGKNYTYTPPSAHGPSQSGPTGLIKIGGGIGIAILAIIMAGISLGWIVAIISVIATGTLFGIVFVGIPIWIVIVFLTAAYNIVLLPFRGITSMHRRDQYGYGHNPTEGWFGVLDAIMWFTIIGLMLWLIWTFVPETHILWERLANWVTSIK